MRAQDPPPGIEVGDSARNLAPAAGDYTAAIRCVSDKQIAFFVIAVPSPRAR